MAVVSQDRFHCILKRFHDFHHVLDFVEKEVCKLLRQIYETGEVIHLEYCIMVHFACEFIYCDFLSPFYTPEAAVLQCLDYISGVYILV